MGEKLHVQCDRENDNPCYKICGEAETNYGTHLVIIQSVPAEPWAAYMYSATNTTREPIDFP